MKAMKYSLICTSALSEISMIRMINVNCSLWLLSGVQSNCTEKNLLFLTHDFIFSLFFLFRSISAFWIIHPKQWSDISFLLIHLKCSAINVSNLDIISMRPRNFPLFLV
jgi:hypothetical protein